MDLMWVGVPSVTQPLQKVWGVEDVVVYGYKGALEGLLLR
jgi:hypothetical protein